MITETVYSNRDNINSVELLADGRAEDISATTRMVLTIGDKTFDSNTSPAVFDWASNGANGQLDLVLGHQGIVPGRYVARLVIYNATYPNGLEWDEGFLVIVK